MERALNPSFQRCNPARCSKPTITRRDTLPAVQRAVARHFVFSTQCKDNHNNPKCQQNLYGGFYNINFWLDYVITEIRLRLGKL